MKTGLNSSLKPPVEDKSSNSPLASPASTIESLTREFEHSLDYELPNKLKSFDEKPKSEMSSKANTLKSVARELNYSLDIREATKGQYVVKPQDEEKTRAESPKVSEQTQNLQTQKSQLEELKKELNNSNIKEKTIAEANGRRVSASNNSVGRCSLGPHRSLKSSTGMYLFTWQFYYFY